MYSNNHKPFDLLPFVTRRLLVEFVRWCEEGHNPCTEWEAERFLRTLRQDEVAIHIWAMEKDRENNPHLYRGVPTRTSSVAA